MITDIKYQKQNLFKEQSKLGQYFERQDECERLQKIQQILVILLRMADLDLSRHSLNLSDTKQKYSFPRTKRFLQSNKALCDSLYNMPSSINNRATSLGYGTKQFGDQRKKFIPGVGAYNFNSEINPEANLQKSISFGVSRQKMEQGGALGHIKVLQKIPGPSSYNYKDVNDYRGTTMRGRHPDLQFQKSTRNPGPGTYQHINMGSKSYYLNSMHPNNTNVNISKVSRLEPLSKKPKVGPSDYNAIDTFNGKGRYSLAKHQGGHSCVFSRSQRQGLTEKTQKGFPGPGAQQVQYYSQIFFRFQLKCSQYLLIIIPMIKPKTQQFRLKFMLIKLEAVINRVSTRCHASLKIDHEQLLFKVTPELKKNTALFNSQVEFDSFQIQLDEVTGLYQQKNATLVVEVDTQGTKMKMGEVLINLGAILNQKKYRMVSQYPLAKCYDKTAKVRLSVDFIPVGALDTLSDKKQKKQFKSSVVITQTQYLQPGSAIKEKRSPPLKSRLAQESNAILQERIYEYQQKMQNNRLSHNQIQQRLHEQISHKDEQIAEMTVDVNRKNQQVAAFNLENEQLRFKIKELQEQISSLNQQKRSLVEMVQTSQKTQDSLKNELSTLKNSLQNLSRTKQHKEKYYSQEINKYTSRYLESEQERNKIIFQLQTKFKEEIEKKQNNYKNIITSTQKKYEEVISNFKKRVGDLQGAILQLEQSLDQLSRQNNKLNDNILYRDKQLQLLNKKHNDLTQQHNKLKQTNSQTINQLETLNFSYNQFQHQLHRHKDELSSLKKQNEQLKMELVMANQTIEEQHKNITKYTKELQVHQERQYFLTQKYNEEIEIKSINEENIIGESHYFREQILILKNKLKIAEEKTEDQSHRVSQMNQTVQRMERELTQRAQSLMRLGQQKMSIQNQTKVIRNELADMEEAVLLLKEENMQLGQMLREKKAAIDNDHSLQWSYKIQQLQNDISEMVEKFRVEKDTMRQTFRRQQSKKKQQLAQMSLQVKKAKEQTQDFKRQMHRKQLNMKEQEKSVDDLKLQLKGRGKQIDQLNDKIRQLNTDLQQLQKKQKTIEQNYQTKLRDAESKTSKQNLSIKKMEMGKAGLQRIIEGLLNYISKPIQAVASFQELYAPEVDIELVNLINLSLKKHCEERTRQKELFKKLENEVNSMQTNNIRQHDLDNYKVKEKVIIQDRKQQYVKHSHHLQSWKQPPTNHNYELDQLRDENGRLKRQISQLKMKARNIEEQVAKAERQADNQRHDKNQVKRQLEEVQDQVDKLNFMLKRKDKALIQFQTDIKELQAQILSIRSSPSQPQQKSNPPSLSRAEQRLRQKQESQSNSRKDIVIRQLQNRLESKSKQLQTLMTETNKLRNESQVHKETVLHLNNENKLLQSKLKDRYVKYHQSQTAFMEIKSKLEDQKNSLILQHKQEVQTLAEEIMHLQEQIILHQKNNQQLTFQLQQSQKKYKNAKQDSRKNQLKLKKEQELLTAQLKSNISELQDNIACLQSWKEQLTLKQKEEAVRTANHSSLLAKRTQQIDSLNSQLHQKEQKIFQLEESLELLKSQSDNKIFELQELIEQMQLNNQKKEYEMEQFKFVSQGKMLDLERQLEEIQQRM